MVRAGSDSFRFDLPARLCTYRPAARRKTKVPRPRARSDRQGRTTRPTQPGASPPALTSPPLPGWLHCDLHCCCCCCCLLCCLPVCLAATLAAAAAAAAAFRSLPSFDRMHLPPTLHAHGHCRLLRPTLSSTAAACPALLCRLGPVSGLGLGARPLPPACLASPAVNPSREQTHFPHARTPAAGCARPFAGKKAGRVRTNRGTVLAPLAHIAAAGAEHSKSQQRPLGRRTRPC
jgi:hypothetical protein